MRPTITMVILSILFSTMVHGQGVKMRINIDGEQYLSIRENAEGFKYITQHNSQTSMYFGFNSGLNTIDDPAVFGSATYNTAYGFNTLSSTLSGKQNTAIGANAMSLHQTGHGNTGIGFSALRRTSGMDNTAVGSNAMINHLTGGFNVAIGHDALNTCKRGDYSVVIGATAGVNDTASNNNVYIGFGAGRGTVFATDGYDRSENVMLGSHSGYQCSTSGNVMLGYRAGYFAKADNQLYIANSSADSLNALIYGQFDNDYLRVNGDLNIDGLYTLPNTAPTSGQFLRYTNGTHLNWAKIDAPWNYGSGDDILYEDGDVGIGTGNAIYRLDVQDNVSSSYVARFRNTNTGPNSKGIIIQAGPIVNPSNLVFYAMFKDGNGSNIGNISGNGGGGTAYNTVSDRRLKQNISTYTKGLDLVSQIRPTSYQMKSAPDREEIGFIAQELYEVYPQIVSGQPTNDVENDPMTVDYGRLTPVLVSAIQEQQAQIEALQALVKAQQGQVSALQAEVSKMQGVTQK